MKILERLVFRKKEKQALNYFLVNYKSNFIDRKTEDGEPTCQSCETNICST